MALYKPPTRVTTISIPLISLVNRADPDRERFKHREAEWYEGGGWTGGKIFFADPYKRGAYAIPVKRVTIAYSGPATFHAGDLTGVGQDFVYVNSTSATPGNLTTRTAAQMFSDIAGAYPGLDYNLRINNTGGGGDLILVGGSGVGILGYNQVPNNTYSDCRVQFTDSSDAVITVWTWGNPYNASPH